MRYPICTIWGRGLSRGKELFGTAIEWVNKSWTENRTNDFVQKRLVEQALELFIRKISAHRGFSLLLLLWIIKCNCKPYNALCGRKRDYLCLVQKHTENTSCILSMAIARLSYALRISPHGVTGTGGGKEKYLLNTWHRCCPWRATARLRPPPCPAKILLRPLVRFLTGYTTSQFTAILLVCYNYSKIDIMQGKITY